MIFAPRQIQEKCIEQNMYMVFIDFTKVFDTVDQSSHLKILQKLDLQTGINALVKLTGK